MAFIDLKKLNTLIGASMGGGGGGVNPPLVFKGLWNADTNVPLLMSSVGTEGDFYIVSVAGSTNLDGITDWEVRDWAVFVNGAWNKIDNTEPVPVPPTFGEMFFQGNAAETVITTIDTPVKIAGTYVTGELQQMTHNTGVLTYTGEPDTLVVIATTTESYNLVNASTTMKIAKDGVALATSGQEIDLDGVTPSFDKNTVMKLVPVVNGSTISVFTENNGGGVSIGTENITHRDLHVLVFSMGAGASAGGSSGVPVLTVGNALNIVGGAPGVNINRPLYTRQGDIVTINFKAIFTTIASGITSFSLIVPFSPAFTAATQVTAVAEIQLALSMSLSDGSKRRSINTTPFSNSIEHIFICAAAAAYEADVTLMYQIQ